MSTFDTTDLDEGAIALFHFADYIDDAAILQGAKQIAIDDMERRFATETDPSGVRWKKLAPRYAEAKARDGFYGPILTREGVLRDAATDEGSWSVTGDSVWFSTRNLPGYWEAHEKGTPEKIYYREVGDKMLEAGEFGGLPQRRFIGLSDIARAEIAELADQWMDFGMTATAAPFKSDSDNIIRKVVKGAGGKPQWHIGGKWGPMV